jgi:hypothetical protein
LFALCPWLQTSRIVYWGDLDVSGFEILNRLRADFAQTVSVFMDEATLDRFGHLSVAGKGLQAEIPGHLTPHEVAAFVRVRSGNRMLEQEKIPHTVVVDALRALFSP